MVRAVPLLVSAILLSRPGMPKEEAARYATVLNQVAKENDFDPLTVVAMVHFESRWLPSVVSADGEDYGLGQVRARFVGACKDDVDPVGFPSDACKAVKASLLDAETNIRRIAGIISANRDFCKRMTGTARAEQWLAGYQGLNFPERRKWCQPGEKTHRVLDYRKELLDTLLPKPKAKAAPKSASTDKAPPKSAPIDKAPPKSAPANKAPAKSAPVKKAPLAAAASAKPRPAVKSTAAKKPASKK